MSATFTIEFVGHIRFIRTQIPQNFQVTFGYIKLSHMISIFAPKQNEKVRLPSESIRWIDLSVKLFYLIYCICNPGLYTLIILLDEIRNQLRKFIVAA